MAHLQSVFKALAALVLLFSFHSVSSLVSSPTSTLMTTISSEHNNVTDWLALLSFKAAVSNNPRGSLGFWNDSNHFCKWPGVTCSGHRHPQRVISLNLSSLDLQGYISPS